MQLDTLGLLIDIRNAAGFIVEDTSGATYDEFLQDRRMRQLVERNFTIIYERVWQATQEFLPILYKEIEALLPEDDREVSELKGQ